MLWRLATAAITGVWLIPVPPAVAQNAYSIPGNLTPVREWTDGFTLQEAERFRAIYTAGDFITGGDATAFLYLNLSELVPTMVISRGGPVVPLESAPMPEIGQVVAATELGTLALGQAIDDPRSRLQAIAVLHKGRIVYEHYPGMPRQQKHLWNSASKPITGLLVHLLVSEGHIDLTAPVSTYLAFTTDTPVGAVSVADVLHHRSGLDFEESLRNFANPEHPLGRGLGSAFSPRGLPAGPGIKDILGDVVAHRPPNTAFEYSSANTQILGFIVEAVTGHPWNHMVTSRIWSQSGMEGDALLAISAAGEGVHGGGFASTLRDFARFALLFTPSWRLLSDDPIVPTGYLQNVSAAADPDIYDAGLQGRRMIRIFGPEDAPIGASYQWDAVFADGDLYKGGLGGQAIYISPETDTAVVYFSTTWRNSLSMSAYARAIVNQVFRQSAD